MPPEMASFSFVDMGTVQLDENNSSKKKQKKVDTGTFSFVESIRQATSKLDADQANLKRSIISFGLSDKQKDTEDQNPTYNTQQTTEGFAEIKELELEVELKEELLYEIKMAELQRQIIEEEFDVHGRPKDRIEMKLQ